MTAPVLSVFVLAYNERANLEAACGELLAALAALGVPFELVVVDDGSVDGTGAEADRLAAAFPALRVIHHGANRGLGGGYRTGFAEARGTYLSFFPADGQFVAAEILRPFLQAAQEGADLVLGYIPDRRSSRTAMALSRAERALYGMLFGPFPRFQGVLMVKMAVVRAVPLVSDGRGWAVVMELILKVARGPFRVVGVPNTLRPRRSGVSKVNNLATVLANLRQLWPLWRELGRG
ncbi:MAG: glycosyltransferase [Myxococcales bacterium]|nr:glycosyltransferase [Myxococcales bacterium]